MNDVQRRAAAKHFSEYWKGKGYEKGESQKFWLSLLGDVFGVEHAGEYISFEDQVHLDHTSFIDGYIPETHVLIEQKSIDKDLLKPIKQSDGTLLTPRDQAQRYIHALLDEKGRDAVPKWVVICNFAEFHVYDMVRPQTEPIKIKLKDLPTQYYLLEFLVRKEDMTLQQEMEISIQAGEIVGLLYEAFLKEYKDPTNAHSLQSLNQLCVRLVFCLYAEDAGIFGKRLMFHDYMQHNGLSKARQALIDLFKVLDTPVDKRDPYMDDELAAFPYVNGGLFSDENIEIPRFNPEIYDLLLNKASAAFDWSEISPTIFGAVFESTLNPETRRKGGMHYTSIENIHKVIDPLFLNDLKAELEAIKAVQVQRTREQRLRAFQDKIASLRFLDPAAGSGNFLTESYLCLRQIENEVIDLLQHGQIVMGVAYNPIKVSIAQFYGIEINDFAATVAKTALWIAESQMMKRTEDIVHMQLDFLPLKSYVNIVEGNALRIDWNDVVPAQELSYIMGNPPFVGQAMRTKEQAQDMQAVFAPSPNGGKLDYVGGWYKKAADFIMGTGIEVAFVSSNSICQGESVNLLWEMLLTNGIIINFAHTTFKWTSEAKEKAAVMCVIVGFSTKDRRIKQLFTGEQYVKVDHINGYLNPAPDVFIKNRSKSINKGLAKVVQGNPPADDGRLLLSASERNELLAKYPELDEVIRPFVGSREFINDIGFSRYCFWFDGISPAKFRHIPELVERFNYVREYRLKSPVDRIQKTASTPYLFTQNRQPKTNYLIIPRVSSSSRKYIPIGFLPPNVIASDSAVLVYDASLYEFGIICSNVHNAWMRTIAGRLKNDYRYAPSVYYNFPFPVVTDQQRQKIERTAQAILDARKLYPNNSLADMYGGEMYMFPELLTAHQQNDRAVMEAYGMPIKETTESSCVAELMRRYQALTATEGKKK